MASVGKRFTAGVPNDLTEAQRRAPVVLMVSGGADSTALMVLAATSKLDINDGAGTARIARERLHVLHVNHELRGIDALEDEEFVRGLAKRCGIPCTVRRVDVKAEAAQEDKNIESAGRRLRYAYANELANQLCAEFGVPRSTARIVTAHTADDRAETFFMNAIKGSGPAGLASVPRVRNRIVRPLLDRTHESLCDFLRMRGIVWREDETNNDTHYLRAFVRHELMPRIKERNPRVVSNLSSTCDILSDEDSFLTMVANRTYRDLVRREADGMVTLDADRLEATDVAIARRVIRIAFLHVAPEARLEARHVERTLELTARRKGSQTIPLSIDVKVEYGLLFIMTKRAQEKGLSGWLPVPGSLDLGRGKTLTARLSPVPQGSDPIALAKAHGHEWAGSSVLLDAETCGVAGAGAELWVEPPQAGEVICPLGMQGRLKKLSDLLCDAKIPTAQRNRLPIVHLSPTGPIIWVGGLRADERYRCTHATKVLLELHIL